MAKDTDARAVELHGRALDRLRRFEVGSKASAARGPWWRPPRPRTIIKVHLVEELVGGGFRAYCGVKFSADALAESRTQLLGECTCGTCRRIYTLRASKGKA